MPKKTNKVINVAKYMPQIKNVAKRQLIIGQLDELEAFARKGVRWKELRDRIDQIKKDFLLVI